MPVNKKWRGLSLCCIIDDTLKGDFSRRLQRYYSRQGNRLLFSNGMNLNQLAWEMWERLNYSEIDPSVLSRVLSGQRLFTSRQLACFCRLLNLSNTESLKLKEYLSVEAGDKYGLIEEIIHKKDRAFYELAVHSFHMIRSLERKDQPVLALTYTDELLALINKHTFETRSRKMNLLLKELYARILFERTYCINVIKIPAVSFYDNLRDSKRIELLAREVSDPLLIAKANLIAGDVFYFKKNFTKALPYFLKSINSFSLEENSDEPFSPLRTAFLCYAYENQLAKAQDLETRIKSVLPSAGIETQAMIWEGLARGYALLKQFKKVESSLNNCADICDCLEKNNLHFSALRKIQLTRTLLEINRLAPSVTGGAYLLKKGREAVELALRNGYQRHAKTINDLILSEY